MVVVVVVMDISGASSQVIPRRLPTNEQTKKERERKKKKKKKKKDKQCTHLHSYTINHNMQTLLSYLQQQIHILRTQQVTVGSVNRDGGWSGEGGTVHLQS